MASMTREKKGRAAADPREQVARVSEATSGACRRVIPAFCVAVGTRVTPRPPHRSVRAAFPHTAPTSGV
jgi:hypothetical protein